MFTSMIKTNPDLLMNLLRSSKDFLPQKPRAAPQEFLLLCEKNN